MGFVAPLPIASRAQPIGWYLAELLTDERAARDARRGRRALSVWGRRCWRCAGSATPHPGRGKVKD
jgi:hypothetical protein